MDDIYYRPLSTNEYIYMYLKEYINEVSICKQIIKYKNNYEYNEILEYYSDIWNNIIGEYYYMRDNQYNKFSYIFNDKLYVIKTDFKLDFFFLTGVSYQTIELIHELIKNKGQYSSDILKYDDYLYNILSNKILNDLKQIKYIY